VSGRIALQVNAAIGVITTLVAAAVIWLALTRPAEVARAMAAPDYRPMIAVIGHQLAGWLHALLRLL
jgi:hypothetical protein